MQIYHPDTQSPTIIPDYRATNDLGLGDRYTDLAKFQDEVPSQPTDCAIVVGAGGLLSMADVLPPTVYMADKDTRLLEWMAKAVAAIQEAETLNEYKTVTMSGANANFGLWFYGERDIFGDLHFLASQERYDMARKAVAAKTIGYLSINFADTSEVEQLAVHLRSEDRQISILNATNMHRHILNSYGEDGLVRYLNALKDLPWAGKYRILCSAIRTLMPLSLPIQTSLEGYVDLAMSNNPHNSPYLDAQMKRRAERHSRMISRS